MKAHIHPQPRAVLLWRFGPGSAGCDALLRQAAAFGLQPVFLTPAQLGCRIGDLCAGRAAALPCPASADAWQTPAMVVSGLRHDNGDLNAFLDAVQRGGADFPIRAAVTPTSAGWTLARLLEELAAEHRALGGRPQ